MNTEIPPLADSLLIPEELRLHRFLSLWLCRLLTIPKVREKFIKTSGFGDSDVSRFLGLSDGDGKLREVDYKPELASAALRDLHAELEKAVTGDGLPDYLEANLQQLQKALHLDHLEGKIFLLFALREDHPMIRDAFNLVEDGYPQRIYAIIARILNAPPELVRKAFNKEARLRSIGLLEWSTERKSGQIPSIGQSEIDKGLIKDDFSIARATREIAIPAPAPTLEVEDFEHLEKMLTALRPYLKQVVQEGTKGVNIYLYGAPGTGKSELARVLAKDAAAGLFEVSSEDAEGDAKGGNARIVSLRMAQALIKGQRAAAGRRVFLNRIVLFCRLSLVRRTRSHFSLQQY